MACGVQVTVLCYLPRLQVPRAVSPEGLNLDRKQQTLPLPCFFKPLFRGRDASGRMSLWAWPSGASTNPREDAAELQAQVCKAGMLGITDRCMCQHLMNQCPAGCKAGPASLQLNLCWADRHTGENLLGHASLHFCWHDATQARAVVPSIQLAGS